MVDAQLPDVAAMGRVAVLIGGWSAEREVSLKSGEQVLAALQGAGVDAFAVDVQRDELHDALVGKCDRVFNLLHGTWGEDGNLQGFLDTLDIPYTGSSALASALAMDKDLAKSVCRQHGVRTPQWRTVESVDDCMSAAQEYGYPMVLKPVAEGSSIGVSLVMENELASAYDSAARYGSVMAEQYIDGSEVTVAILNGTVLPAVKITTPNQFYDYDAKYLNSTTTYDCPSGLDAELERQMSDTALRVFQLLKCHGWGRVDFLLDKRDQYFLLEVNTVPGMTDHSLVPMAAREAGVDFAELVVRILATSMESRR
jgi:D-alanine-D-alanine ligase